MSKELYQKQTNPKADSVEIKELKRFLNKGKEYHYQLSIINEEVSDDYGDLKQEFIDNMTMKYETIVDAFIKPFLDENSEDYKIVEDYYLKGHSIQKIAIETKHADYTIKRKVKELLAFLAKENIDDLTRSQSR